ncbi:hypothetical protein AZ34_14480 [Hylemonella gracilis str. Niagara R]|uniref:ORC1/DEAH AAA+ ATPase domain-containing protein n=1 Tax=Hylemonella gracilis str. Niagara R TaxID=1458275 RepID=A0A016XP01_9BURK|nr:AAA family ATPase [Hylemonella gracilis]EYC52943.1 hypothetical protein AZ34_14480 [Hylemonella gracilis str. Niagara R]
MQYIESKFPPELLSDASEKKLDYFKKKIVSHPHLVQSYNLALDCIEFSEKGELVWIVGPAGVGTTQIVRRLWKDTSNAPSEPDEDGMAAPTTATVVVDAPDNAERINTQYWIRLLGDLLHAHGDVLIDRKIYVPPSQFTLTHPIPYADPRNRNFDTLKHAAISMLKHRQTQLLLINQADRLFPESHPSGCLQSLQILRDLAAQTDTRIVLIGSYQLARTACTRNNWLHRQHTVHLRRYDPTDSDEFNAYARTLINLLAHMPTEQRMETLSLEGAKKICISTVGCIGTLKRTLTRAFQHALRTGEKMTEDFILQFTPYNTVAREIARDAMHGERLLLDVSLDDVRSVLNATNPGASSGTGNSSNRSAPKKTTGTQGGFNQRRIGERNSSRDPAGGAYGPRRT